MRLATSEELNVMQVGDLVRSGYYREEEDVVRKVTSKAKSRNHGSGWMVSADAGTPCQCCGKPPGRPIPLVDGFHFVPDA